jgi:hypothetical protein
MIILILSLVPCLLFSYEIMPVDSVREGMKGYGVSVFKGNRLDTFEVEILGVLEDVSPERKMILARLSGSGLEKTGIIAGMSGSPIFINGKIIGAAAYGWSFSLEPITGITPIEEILATKDALYDEYGQDREMKIHGKGMVSPYSGVTLSRIQTPLVVSGFDNWLLKDIETFFSGKGFSVVLGGGSSGKHEGTDSLFVGSGVSAELVQGDASIGAVGTVTYISGNDVYAFGHPLFFSGDVSFPMSTAYVYAVMPSQYSSFKIASPEKEIGAVFQDRSDAIYGVMGEKARTIPLDITVSKEKSSKDFHFTIVDHKDLTPFFAGITITNSILTQGRGYGDLTIDLDVDLRLDPYGSVKVRNFFSGINALTFSSNTINDVISLILNDRFEEITIEGISILAHVSEDERSAMIETAKPSKYFVKRGESVKVTAFMKGSGGENYEEKFTLKIPETCSDSIVKIAVIGADGLISLETERVMDRFVPERPGQFIEMLNILPRNNVLYCMLLTSRVGMFMKGYEMRSLPSSMLHLMEDSQNLGEGRFTKGEIIARLERVCDYVVSGSSVLTLKVTD